MKIKGLHRFLTAHILLSFFLSLSVWAAPPFKGPLPEEQKQNIQFLAKYHDELKREVTLRSDGYAATTTTDNKALAETLKRHFRYMNQRLESGAMVRKWDPAFAQLVHYHDQLTTEVEFLENGISVIVTGKTPMAAKVAQNHASIITEFKNEGADAVHRRHDAVNHDDKADTKSKQDCVH